MVKRDVVADVLGRLDRFVADGGTLPGTNDGKINVSALCRMLGLEPSDAQHFHRKDEIKLTVNALATEAGLLPIGARAEADAREKEITSKIVAVADRAKEDAQDALEARAVAARLQYQVDELIRENGALRARLAAAEERLRFTQETGLVLRDRPASWTGTRSGESG
ncbi:MAG: hypothetical protein ACM31L_06005 [Actinomycetota bacterium]